MAEKKKGNVFGKKMGKLVGDAFETVKYVSNDVAVKAGEMGKDAIDYAGGTFETIKEGGDQLSKKMYEAKIEFEKKRLRPIYKETFLEENYKYPDMIRVVEYDKQHMESEACVGAVGFMDNVDGAEILNIYKRNADLLKIRLFPYTHETIYYPSAGSKNLYVDLGEYFEYEEKQRIAELEHIAYKLGANYFKVTIMEEKKSFVKKSEKASLDVKLFPLKGKGKYDSERSNTKYEVVKSGSELYMDGNNKPSEPELNYFSQDGDIINLIKMRKNTDNHIISKTLHVKYDSSSTIKGKRVAQLDATLKKYKIGGNASINSEVEEESRRIFEYIIEFPSSQENWFYRSFLIIKNNIVCNELRTGRTIIWFQFLFLYKNKKHLYYFAEKTITLMKGIGLTAL